MSTGEAGRPLTPEEDRAIADAVGRLAHSGDLYPDRAARLATTAIEAAAIGNRVTDLHGRPNSRHDSLPAADTVIWAGQPNSSL